MELRVTIERMRLGRQKFLQVVRIDPHAKTCVSTVQRTTSRYGHGRQQHCELVSYRGRFVGFSLVTVGWSHQIYGLRPSACIFVSITSKEEFGVCNPDGIGRGVREEHREGRRNLDLGRIRSALVSTVFELERQQFRFS